MFMPTKYTASAGQDLAVHSPDCTFGIGFDDAVTWPGGTAE